MTVTFLQGDVFESLRSLPADSFDCVVTSPPYWGLRDYGVDGQIGMEPSLGEHLDVMVRVCAEIHRVLKPTGTFWLNYGDCYATSPNGRSAADTKAAGTDDRTFRDKPFSTVGPIFAPDHESGDRRGLSGNKGSNGQAAHNGRIVAGGYLKPKDLCMIPNRLAIALQEWGWWVRSEIVWGKPNPMPDSSGRYRPSTAHEKIWLLTKTGKGFYDHEAVAMPVADTTGSRLSQNVDEQHGSERANGGRKTNGTMKAVGNTETRLLRNYEPADPLVWPINSRGYSEAHFATFPPELAERCIKAGCPAGGHVLDPFGGSGTTGLVADRLQRDCTLIDLNPEYIEMAKARLDRDRGALLDYLEAAE